MTLAAHCVKMEFAFGDDETSPEVNHPCLLGTGKYRDALDPRSGAGYIARRVGHSVKFWLTCLRGEVESADRTPDG